MIVQVLAKLILVVCLVTTVGGQNPFCSSGVAAPGAPQLPDMAYQSFQSHVEVNMLESSLTMDVDMFLDFDGNQGLVKIFQNGMQSQFIYDYDENQIYTIDSLSHCTVQNLSTASVLPLFGDDVTDGIGHIPPASEALRFLQKYNPVFQGYSNVRGIPCAHWKSCQYYGTGKFNYTLDHYFTVGNWSTSSTHISVPVRIEMQGERLFTNGTARTMHHVYDYVSFRADNAVDSMRFEIPKDVFCKGEKSSQTIPQLPQNYYYRQEIIDVNAAMITQADLWYNSDYKLLRIDHRPTSIQPPLTSLNPLTEINDFNYGVRYVRDRVTGNCSVFPLLNGSYDKMDWKASHFNHSFKLDMKDPLSFFHLDSNYTYVGQKLARDALCDVYVSKRSDYSIPGIDHVNTTWEYYFLSEGWSEDPDIGYSAYQSGYPFRLEISAIDVGFDVVYNFLDFDADNTDLSVYDISDCFPDTGKLSFTVQFPTSKTFKRDSENQLKSKAQLALMGAMNVSPIRITRMNVAYDSLNVYVSATLVDKTPSYAQFSYVPGSSIEMTDDMVWNNISLPQTCADLCVTNEAIVCRSFDFCPADGFKCRLSRHHVGDGGVVLKKSVCDHFSRSVDPKSAHETELSEAYSNLEQQIAKNQVYISMDEDSGESVGYSAVDSTINFGQTDSKVIPSIPEQYSYHIEIVYPAKKSAFEADLWYDSKYKLSRMDYRNPLAPPPFYSPFTMTYIYDFNTGVTYNIDQVQQNCTMTPITSSLGISGERNQQDLLNNGALVIQMRSPLEFLHLNYPYTYAGEKTVRGILCDVFEASVPDYHIPTTNYTVKAKFQYYFQSSSWVLIADPSTDTTSEQPIMVHITAAEIGFFMIYNFYNFDDEDPNMSVFDIKPCFGDDQRHQFMITFNQNFHPYLDTKQSLFKREVLQELSDLTNTSPIRFQDLQLSYDLFSTRTTVTILGQPDYILYFSKLQGRHPAHKTSKTISNINNADDCAQACMFEDNFVCNSFDICPSSKTCRLSKLHIDDSLQPANTGSDNRICTHYSRSINGSILEPSMLVAFDTLKDIIYKGAFQVPIATQDSVFMYVATGVRDDIMMTNPPATTEGQYLSQFKVFKGNVILMHNDFVLHQMAVDDCATSCAEESRFDCQSFEFCYTTGDCLMSSLHPDNNQNLIRNHSFCDLYAKKYILDYNKFPGEVLLTNADRTLDQVTSVDLCARNCSFNSDFDCKSFDYCPNINSCRLRKNHILEVPDSSVVSNPSCDHYSRNYVYDFSKTTGKIIQGHNDIVISGVSKADCAKACVEQEGFECRSFEFCPNITECTLTTSSAKTSQLTLVASNTCNLYTRSKIKGSTPYDPNAATHYSTLMKTPDDSGAKAGLAIGMLLLGGLLGALILFLVFRFRSNQRGEDFYVQFNNKTRTEED